MNSPFTTAVPSKWGAGFETAIQITLINYSELKNNFVSLTTIVGKKVVFTQFEHLFSVIKVVDSTLEC